MGRKRKTWKVGLAVLGGLFLSVLFCAAAMAGEDGGAAGAAGAASIPPELLEQFDFTGVESFLNRQEGTSFTFQSLLGRLLEGDVGGIFTDCLASVRSSLFLELKMNGKWLGQVMVLGLIGALFANFAGIFSNSQIAEAGFYVTYLVMFTLLASSFLTALSVAGKLLETVMDFMRALLPSYFLVISFSGGAMTSAAGYGWILFALGCVDWLVLKILMPVLQVYLLMVLAGHLIKEDLFSRTTELMETGMRWSVKTLVGIVLGFQLIQGMVTPYADSLKSGSLQRVVSAIPGLGQGAASISQTVMGAGVLLKNSVGAGAVIILALLSLLPLVKLILLDLFYHGAAAILQPVCDKRMVACIGAVGKACQLLISMVSMVLLMLGLSLAIVCMAANASYFSL